MTPDLALFSRDHDQIERLAPSALVCGKKPGYSLAPSVDPSRVVHPSSSPRLVVGFCYCRVRILRCALRYMPRAFDLAHFEPDPHQIERDTEFRKAKAQTT
jgi:hypothetical protein